jgi:dTDP-4-amino-4,6-dideoxy-D-galactose acyltransferase
MVWPLFLPIIPWMIGDRAMPSVQLLDWDSDFFGFRVAKIIPPRLTRAEIVDVLEQLRSDRITLAYWASDPEDDESRLAAETGGFFLADKKVTYIRDITTLDISNLDCDEAIQEYRETSLNADLVSLALQSGTYSRFRVDSKIPAHKFEQLYELWIEKSVNKTIAESVLIKKLAGKIVGMVTVGVKNNCGDIGLIAVDESARGMKIGERLVHAALKWSVIKGHTTAQVVTQGVNEIACKLYEKCGYHVGKSENVYHVWLQ